MTPPYDWLIPVAAAPFIGSFVSVLAVRLPAHEDVVSSRSRCRRCGHQLHAHELVPLASWLALHGRCSHCGAAIEWLYPAMELAAIGVAVWAASVVGGGMLWITVLLGWTLLALLAMDVRSLVLADVLTLPLVVAGFAAIAIIDQSQLWAHVAAAFAGFALIVAVAFIYRALRGRDGLGFGDAKLMAAAGAWTGIDGIGSVLLYAAACGLLIAALMRITGREVAATTEIPFGAGIAVGMWFVWLNGPLIFGH